MSDVFFTALGLMLVIEGILPLVAPSAWRETFSRLLRFSDGQLRFVGLMSLAGGILFLVLTHSASS